MCQQKRATGGRSAAISQVPELYARKIELPEK